MMQSSNAGSANSTTNAWNAWKQPGGAAALFPKTGATTAAEKLRHLSGDAKQTVIVPSVAAQRPKLGARSNSNSSVGSATGAERDAARTDGAKKQAKAARKKTTGPVHNSRYKAKLCKNWMKNGACPYFEKCQFAHGTTELLKWANRRARTKSDDADSEIEFNQNNHQDETQSQNEGRSDSVATTASPAGSSQAHGAEDNTRIRGSNQEEEDLDEAKSSSEPVASKTFAQGLQNTPAARHSDGEEEEEECKARSDEDLVVDVQFTPRNASPESVSTLASGIPSAQSASAVDLTRFVSGRSEDVPATSFRDLVSEHERSRSADPMGPLASKLASSPGAESASPARDLLPDLSAKFNVLDIGGFPAPETFCASVVGARSASAFSTDSLFQPLSTLSSASSSSSSSSISSNRFTSPGFDAPARAQSTSLPRSSSANSVSPQFGACLAPQASPFRPPASQYSAFQRPDSLSGIAAADAGVGSLGSASDDAQSFQLFGMGPIFEQQGFGGHQSSLPAVRDCVPEAYSGAPIAAAAVASPDGYGYPSFQQHRQQLQQRQEQSLPHGIYGGQELGYGANQHQHHYQQQYGYNASHQDNYHYQQAVMAQHPSSQDEAYHYQQQQRQPYAQMSRNEQHHQFGAQPSAYHGAGFAGSMAGTGSSTFPMESYGYMQQQQQQQQRQQQRNGL